MPQHPRIRSLIGATDRVIGLMLAVAAVGWANQPSLSPVGLPEFLKIRMTPLNASFSIVFVVLWQQCMQALGLYRRSVELFRPLLMTVTGVGIMTAVLAIFLEARHAHGPMPRTLAAFF